MSERDGWNHLYLYDGDTGQVKNQITQGEWVVRGVDSVDEENRQIWFRASGMDPDQDPYFIHYYRINFDGTGLVAYTEADGTHTVTFSPSREFYVDQWSRVDLPPVAQLRRTDDQSLVMELERADASALLATGLEVSRRSSWPRDGTGSRTSGASSFGPRTSTRTEPTRSSRHLRRAPRLLRAQDLQHPHAACMSVAELGFIVAQIDGMGTNEPVQGLPRRGLEEHQGRRASRTGSSGTRPWPQRYPYYDISRVGIYGRSAGGQNAMGALLFHPDFYDVAVSAAGCHDNRMDKIWWNEAWMGWPIGPHYAASSNVDNAQRLQGKLLLVVRRAGHQRGPLLHHAGGERPHRGRQGLRLPLGSRRRARVRRRLRSPEAERLLRPAPPGCRTSGLERIRGEGALTRKAITTMAFTPGLPANGLRSGLFAPGTLLCSSVAECGGEPRGRMCPRPGQDPTA